VDEIDRGSTLGGLRYRRGGGSSLYFVTSGAARGRLCVHPAFFRHAFSEGEKERVVEVHQTRERVEQAEHAQAHEKKRAALLIIVLAVALAIVEMAGKEAQFTSIAANIKASDVYAFYQAKTIRHTLLLTVVEGAEALGPAASDAAVARANQLKQWKETIARLESDPKTGEGRQELLARARSLEQQRDEQEHEYHHFEYAAGGLQLAIVIASASVITETAVLELLAALLGIGGLGIAALGWAAPMLLRL
jgi:uncharacterized protein DUF4337